MSSSLLNNLLKQYAENKIKRGRPSSSIPFCMSKEEWHRKVFILSYERKKLKISQTIMAFLSESYQKRICDFEKEKLYDEDIFLIYVIMFIRSPKDFLNENSYIGYCAKREDLINKIKNSIYGKGDELWDEKRSTLISQRLSELENQKK